MRLLFNVDEPTVLSVDLSDFIRIIKQCVDNDLREYVDYTNDLESPLLYHFLGENVDKSNMDMASYMMTRTPFRMKTQTARKVDLPLFKKLDVDHDALPDKNEIIYSSDHVVIWYEDVLKDIFNLDNEYENTYVQPGSYHPKPYPDTSKDIDDILIKVKYAGTVIVEDETYVNVEWSFEHYDLETFKKQAAFTYMLAIDKYYIENFESVYKLCIKKHLSGNA
jgi:hypothetical protein